MSQSALSADHRRLCAEAKSFVEDFCAKDHPELFGLTDGKAVGTYAESRFKEHLRNGGFLVADDEGNAAKGIDLPRLETDIKVTSARQPQSSAPFRDFRQKIDGLGYNLILFVYVKTDSGRSSHIDFPTVRFIPKEFTGDFQTTRYLRQLIADEALVEDIVAYLQDRNMPADNDALFEYAEQLMEQPPRQGFLTISNALQWRLQYRRVASQEIPGVPDVLV